MKRIAAVLCIGLMACQAGEISQPINEELVYEGTGPVPEGCVKIEDNDIGDDGIEVELGDCTVTVDSWQEKDGEDDEYVGFSLSFDCDVDAFSFVVKSGQDVDEGTGLSWVNPRGTGGKNAKGISNVTFCYDGPPPEPECDSEVDCECDDSCVTCNTVEDCQYEQCADADICNQCEGCECDESCEQPTCETNPELCTQECVNPDFCGASLTCCDGYTCGLEDTCVPDLEPCFGSDCYESDFEPTSETLIPPPCHGSDCAKN